MFVVVNMRVEEELPLKQGLKPLSRSFCISLCTVEEELPLKQGLKLDVTTTVNKDALKLKRNFH